jgi:predicted ABC-type ATPase
MSLIPPLQVMVVPITDKSYEYAQHVRTELRKGGFHCDVDTSNNKMQKKVKPLDQYFMLEEKCTIFNKAQYFYHSTPA